MSLFSSDVVMVARERSTSERADVEDERKASHKTCRRMSKSDDAAGEPASQMHVYYDTLEL